MNGAGQTRVLVLGAGRQAVRIVQLLSNMPGFAPCLGSCDGDALADARQQGLPGTAATVEVTRASLPRQLAEVQAVIVTDTVFEPVAVARAAQEAGCVYLDILETPRWVGQLQALSREDGAAIAPGCGLAPGYVTALAAEAVGKCGPEAALTVFAGVLPKAPGNRLGYANIWGIDGLIDEYTQPCAAIRDAACVMLPPLQEEEQIAVGGQTYEGFTTAGSLDGLTAPFAGRVGEMVFKTLRYPGHLDHIRFLLDDMGLSQRIYQFRSLLLTSLPKTSLDRVLIALRVVPEPGARPQWQTQVFEAGVDDRSGVQSASATVTAAHVCAVLDVLTMPGTAPRIKGWVPPGRLLPDALRRSVFFGHFNDEQPNRGGGPNVQVKATLGHAS